MGAILLDEQVAPGTPSMGQVVIYPKSDGELYKKDDTGAEAAMSVSSATDTTEGIVELATQAEQEAGTDATRAVTPGRQHFHPSAAKFWAKFNSAGTVAASYNVTSITDSATGQWVVNIGTDFSSADWFVSAFCGHLTGVSALFATTDTAVAAMAAGTMGVQVVRRDTGSYADPNGPDSIWVGGFGDQ